MSTIKMLTIEALASALESYSADLTGRVRAFQQPPTEQADYDGIAVTAEGTWGIEWWYEDEVRDQDGDAIIVGANSDQALVEIGEMMGTVRLWTAAHYIPGRAELEDLIILAFNQLEGAPGRLDFTLPAITIAGVETAHTPNVSASMDSEAWEDGFAFSHRRWAEMDLSVEVPILILRANAPRIAEYRLCLTEDIETDISGAATPDEATALLDPPPIEDYTVDQNGDYTET